MARLTDLFATETNQKQIVSLLCIFDLLIKDTCLRNYIKNSSPLKTVMRIVRQFPNDELLSVHLCSLIVSIIDKETIILFLEVLAKKTADEVFELEGNGVYEEIKAILTEERRNLFNLRNIIIKVFLLIAKDAVLLSTLNQINSIEIFLSLLESDLVLLEKQSFTETDNLIQLLKLIFRVLSAEDMNDEEKSESYRVKTIEILVRALGFIGNNSELVRMSLDFLLLNQNKPIIEDYFFNKGTINLSNVLGDMYKNNHKESWFVEQVKRLAPYLKEKESTWLDGISRLNENETSREDKIASMYEVSVRLRINSKIKFKHQVLLVNSIEKALPKLEKDPELLESLIDMTLNSIESVIL